MIRNAKPAIQKPSTTTKKKSKKTGEALRKEVLASISKLGTDNGEAPAVPKADAAPSKPAGKTKKEKAAKPKKEKPARKPSLLDHAAAVLAKSPDPLNAKQIVEKVMATTDWKTEGLTPHATLYSAMIREIAEKKKDSRFTKIERGLFAAGKAA